MSKRPKEIEPRAVDASVTMGGAPAAVFESGVISKGLADEIDREPPWDIVQSYLTRGEHGFWVEAWAARSPAFRDVIDALRNDHEERAARRRRNVVPLKRSRST